MKFFTKYGTRRNEIAKAKREFYLLLTTAAVIGILFAGIIFIARIGPKATESEMPQTNTSNSSTTPSGQIEYNDEESRANIIHLISKLQQSEDQGNLDSETIAEVEKAIQLQRSLIERRSREHLNDDIQRLAGLTYIYENDLARKLRDTSIDCEERALELLEQEKTAAALEQLKRAIEHQEEINHLYPRSEAQSASRLQKLRAQLTGIQAEPAFMELQALMEKSKNLRAENKFSEAIHSTNQAILIQESLNNEFRHSKYASLSKLKSLQAAKMEMEADRDGVAVLQMLKELNAFLENPVGPPPVELAESAIEKQQILVQAFPTSKYSEDSFQLKVKEVRDSVASLKLYREYNMLDDKLLDAVQNPNRNVPQSVTTELYRIVETIKSEFPDSRYLDNIQPERIHYLYQKRQDIEMIASSVRATLIPLNESQKLMSAQEVSQVLFEQVMSKNPSSDVSPLNPVESVTYLEALEFNEKLSWLLGIDVRLPTENEIRWAIEGTRMKDIQIDSWHQQNTGRKTQKVRSSNPNPKGFYDLHGNVAEWISGTADGNEAIALGGSARDNPIRLNAVPEEKLPANERNRFIGFRIVVEIPDSVF